MCGSVIAHTLLWSRTVLYTGALKKINKLKDDTNKCAGHKTYFHCGHTVWIGGGKKVIKLISIAVLRAGRTSRYARERNVHHSALNINYLLNYIKKGVKNSLLNGLFQSRHCETAVRVFWALVNDPQSSQIFFFSWVLLQSLSYSGQTLRASSFWHFCVVAAAIVIFVKASLFGRK